MLLCFPLSLCSLMQRFEFCFSAVRSVGNVPLESTVPRGTFGTTGGGLHQGTISFFFFSCHLLSVCGVSVLISVCVPSLDCGTENSVCRECVLAWFDQATLTLDSSSTKRGGAMYSDSIVWQSGSQPVHLLSSQHQT